MTTHADIITMATLSLEGMISSSRWIIYWWMDWPLAYQCGFGVKVSTQGCYTIGWASNLAWPRFLWKKNTFLFFLTSDNECRVHVKNICKMPTVNVCCKTSVILSYGCIYYELPFLCDICIWDQWFNIIIIIMTLAGNQLPSAQTLAEISVQFLP